MEDWVSLFLRTLFIYFFILLMIRIMGAREIGQLTVFDLVVSIMIAEMGSIVLEEDMPLLAAVIPIATLVLTQMALAFVFMRSKRIRDLVDGKPAVLIADGNIREDELARQRYNLDDLLSQLRENQIFNVADVEMAVLEPSGKLNVLPKREKRPLTREDLDLELPDDGLAIPLIMDGRVLDRNLELIGQNRFWLREQVRRQGCKDFREVFFASVDRHGRVHVDARDKKTTPPPDI